MDADFPIKLYPVSCRVTIKFGCKRRGPRELMLLTCILERIFDFEVVTVLFSPERHAVCAYREYVHIDACC